MKTKLSVLALTSLLMSSAFAQIINKEFANGNIERVHRGKNQIILTFDDGPTPGVTEKVLSVLKANQVKGTFFIVAQNAKRHPEIMNKIKAEGHLIGNHSMSHPKLGSLGFFSWKKVVKEEVLDAHEIIFPYMQPGQRFYFRAPHASWDSKISKYLNKTDVGAKYIGPVLWDIGGDMEVEGDHYSKTADWACWSKKLTVDECLEGYLRETDEVKGGVILMHDLVSKSAEMLAKLIPELKLRGYTFATLEDAQFE